jgi:acetyl-CoA carboxylase biotin carboxyl carrier protein
VTTIEFPKRDDLGAAESPDAGAPQGTPAITLTELREQTRALAEELPGTLRRITLRAGGLRVDVEWEGAPAQVVAGPQYPPQYPPPYATQYAPPPAETAPVAAGPAAAQAAAEPPAPQGIPVTAPLVGTFYRSSSPSAEPFVKVGDVVEPGQTLAIIEAMKLLNNIAAEHRAKVVAIHVDNGDVVEFAQPLMDLEPID